MTKSFAFNEGRVLHDLKHYLPSQTPLKDFIHHNALHPFQQLEFFQGIFRASSLFGYKVTLTLVEFRRLYQSGRISKSILQQVLARRFERAVVREQWHERLVNGKYACVEEPRVGRLRKRVVQKLAFDLDNQVQPLFFRIIGSYLDQGIALWHFPFTEEGLIPALRKMEKMGYASFFPDSPGQGTFGRFRFKSF